MLLNVGTVACHGIELARAPLLIAALSWNTPERAARKQLNAHCLSILLTLPDR